MAEDIRILTSFLNHRKRKKLRKNLGSLSDTYLLNFWLTVRMAQPDGNIADWDEADIAEAAGWIKKNPEPLIKALVNAGLLDTLDGGGYHPHNWERHQGYAVGAEERSRQGKYKANLRWAREHYNPQCTGQCTGQCHQQCQLQCIEQCNFYTSGNAPLPSPLPLPSPNPLPDPLPLPDPSPDIILRRAISGGGNERDKNWGLYEYFCNGCDSEGVMLETNGAVEVKVICEACNKGTLHYLPDETTEGSG